MHAPQGGGPERPPGGGAVPDGARRRPGPGRDERRHAVDQRRAMSALRGRLRGGGVAGTCSSLVYTLCDVDLSLPVCLLWLVCVRNGVAGRDARVWDQHTRRASVSAADGVRGDVGGVRAVDPAGRGVRGDVWGVAALSTEGPTVAAVQVRGVLLPSAVYAVFFTSPTCLLVLLCVRASCRALSTRSRRALRKGSTATAGRYGPSPAIPSPFAVPCVGHLLTSLHLLALAVVRQGVVAVATRVIEEVSAEGSAVAAGRYLLCSAGPFAVPCV